MNENRNILSTCTLENIPDLDVAVLGALELFEETSLPALHLNLFKKPIVLGSEGAAAVGRILFEEADAVFGNESTYRELLDVHEDIDGAVIVSASGGKHALEMARVLKERGIQTFLFTNNLHAPAEEYIPEKNIVVFPKNREPYTYNTSTYMGMLAAKTGEDFGAIHRFLLDDVRPRIPDNLSAYDAFYFLIPSRFQGLQDLFLAKFDELFGSRVSGRVFTFAQTEHAKTVVPSGKELFVSFGEKNVLFGEEDARLEIPLPERADYVAQMAVGYFFIGHIQKQHPPYFKENIVEYTKRASERFGQDIEPIVA